MPRHLLRSCVLHLLRSCVLNVALLGALVTALWPTDASA
jgi:hypothetical protein